MNSDLKSVTDLPGEPSRFWSQRLSKSPLRKVKTMPLPSRVKLTDLLFDPFGG
jgi:hypothetical protein